MPLPLPSSLGSEGQMPHTPPSAPSRGAIIPLEKYPEFADIRSSHWTTPFDFLRRFKAHLLVYIGDGEANGIIPPIHTYGLGGLSPATTGFPNIHKQHEGYGLYFSVNGFKSNRSRKEDNLYSVNAFFVDIDYPDKKNPPTQEQLNEFKRAVYEDLSSCIANGREDFARDPRVSETAPPPSAIVETKNGFHVYWFLDEPIILDNIKLDPEGNPADERITHPDFHTWLADTERISRLLITYRDIQRAILTRFQGDKQCVDPTRVLRVPGSFHLKNPAEPFLVSLTYLNLDHIYSFFQMREFWLHNPNASTPTYAYAQVQAFIEETKNPAKITKEHQRGSEIQKGLFAAAGLPFVHGGRLPDHIVNEINQAFPITDRPSFRGISSPTGIAPGTRNKSLLIAASLLRKAGHSETDVLARFSSGYNGLPTYEITNTIKSAFCPPQPYDFGWNDPILAEYVTLEEVSRTKEIVKNLMEGERKSLREQAKKIKKSNKIYEPDPSQTQREISHGSHPQDNPEDHQLSSNGEDSSTRDQGDGSKPNGGSERCGDNHCQGEHDAGSSCTASSASDSTETGGDDDKHSLVQSPSSDVTDGGGGDSSEGDVGDGDPKGVSLATVRLLENARPVLDDKTQKRLFSIFDQLFVGRYPNIVSVDDVGFFMHHPTERYYEAMTEDGIRRIVNEYLAEIGCLGMRGTSQIASRVEALEAYAGIRLSREESETSLTNESGMTLVNTQSGLVDFDTGEMVPDSRKIFLTSVQPIHYSPDIPTNEETLRYLAPRWMQFLEQVCASNIPGETQNKIALLQEMAGYCFTPYVHMQTAFILLGNGANGKSTFLDTILRIIGKNDSSSLGLADICSQFRLHGLYRKRINVIEEIPNNYFESDILKKLISGQELVADRKFRTPIHFRPTTKLVFAVNSFPRVNDQSYALYRRFKVIPFNVTFSENAKDPFLLDKLWQERDGIFRWAMQGWQRLKERNRFTQSTESDSSSEDFKEHNSPLVEFMLREGEIESETQTDNNGKSQFVVSIDNLYTSYRTYAKENGYGVKARGSFIKELQTINHYRLKTITVEPGFGGFVRGFRLRNSFVPTNIPHPSTRFTF